ncbi:MAG: CinA family nicotinamide mononucleotide deamidase-related protein [Deltaproteobacteria bacterium]|jgi:nicotinamide-nucleotide amidase
MLGEIIAIGDELTSGRVVNSTSGFAARHLFAAGYEILAMTTIGDSPARIAEVLARALDRADFVVVTGGLGATTDDRTNEAVAAALNRPPTFFPEILAKVKKFAASGTEGIPRQLEKLAWLPEGAEVLSPDAGMAGHVLVHAGKPIFFLPGVPEEMRHLLTVAVIPQLAAWQGGSALAVRQQLYKAFGLSETEINRRLAALEEDDPRIKIGYYPVFPEVHVSLTAQDHAPEETSPLFDRFDAAIRRALGDTLYGTGDETLESVIGGCLAERRQTVATAESCTGGLIGHAITRVAGSSAYYLGGVVAYSNDLKEKLLGVEPETLRRYGAVSGETARAMAEGCRRLTRADYALAVTGVAGPGGGSPEKPVGTVYFGLAASGEEPRDILCRFRGARNPIQIVSAATALDLLRRKLLNKTLEFHAQPR